MYINQQSTFGVCVYVCVHACARALKLVHVSVWWMCAFIGYVHVLIQGPEVNVRCLSLSVSTLFFGVHWFD